MVSSTETHFHDKLEWLPFPTHPWVVELTIMPHTKKQAHSTSQMAAVCWFSEIPHQQAQDSHQYDQAYHQTHWNKTYRFTSLFDSTWPSLVHTTWQHGPESFFASCQYPWHAKYFLPFKEPSGLLLIHKYPALVLIFSQKTTVHTLNPHFFKIPININLPSMSMSSKRSLLFRFSD